MSSPIPHDRTAARPGGGRPRSALPQDARLRDIAQAVVMHPGATLHELAQAVGISRATLYRCMPTRQALLERLYDAACTRLQAIATDPRLSTLPPTDALLWLIEQFIAEKEYCALMLLAMPDRAQPAGAPDAAGSPASTCPAASEAPAAAGAAAAAEDSAPAGLPAWSARTRAIEIPMEAFFLRGQRAGHFRLDVPAATLADTFGFMISGLCLAEQRGRIANGSLRPTMRRLFLAAAGSGEPADPPRIGPGPDAPATDAGPARGL